MAKPIPKHLLIHSATHYFGTLSEDEWGNISHTDSRDLTFVRFEPTSKLVMSKDNREWQLEVLMFYDQRNSRPSGLTFAEGDKVTFNGQDYTVVSNDYLHDEKGLHHQEVGLV